MITLLWALTAFIFLAWTGLAALTHVVLGLSPEAVADLKPLLSRLPLAEWLDGWLPGWSVVAEIALDLGSHLLGLAGALLPWLVVAVWVAWGGGALVLLLLAGVLHAAIRAGQRVEARTQAR